MICLCYLVYLPLSIEHIKKHDIYTSHYTLITVYVYIYILYYTVYANIVAVLLKVNLLLLSFVGCLLLR